MFLSDQVDHHLLVVEKKWDLERTHVRDLPLRPSPPEPQLILIPMSDGDDDQSPHDEKQRERSRSGDRVHPPAKASQELPIQPMDTPEAEEVSDEDFTDGNPSSPSAGPPPSAVCRGRSRREHLHMHHHMPASSHNLLYLPPEFSRPRLWQLRAQMKIQQPWIHKMA